MDSAANNSAADQNVLSVKPKAQKTDIKQNTEKERAMWVDALKGVGILLVVLGHAIGGLIDANVAPAKDWFRPLFAVIYVFHMPLFFFLVGIFVVDRLERNSKRFREQLFFSIVWPYFLWATVQICAINLAGNLVNNPGDGLAISLLRLFYIPPSQFWFLYGLFFLHGTSLLLGDRAKDPLYFIGLLVAGSLAEITTLPAIWRAVMQMAPYYGLGLLFGSRLLKGELLGQLDNKVFLLVPLALLAVILTFNVALDEGVVGFWPATSPAIVADINGFHNFYAALLAVTALIAICSRLQSHMPKWLIYCGRQTMPIFVLHILFIATFRIIVLKSYPEIHPGLLLSILCGIGIVGPLIAAAIADRMRLSKVLGFA